MKNMFLLAVVMTTLLTTTFSIMPLQADPPIAGFTQYGNKYFIETGTCVGSGLQLAVDAGFEVLHSIELAVPFYIQARRRFANTPNVHLWYGDSSKVLPQILRLVDAPATFWLDGHYSGGHTARGTKMSPILEELKHIKNHAIKTHTILIDDVRDFGTPYFDRVTLQQIKDAILQINSAYQFSFIDCRFPNDILVATVPPPGP